MTENNVLIASCAMDLKRVALSYYNGPRSTAKRFSEEALERRREIKKKKVKPYLRKLLAKLPKMLSQKDESKIAEDALMYSTIFQNYVLAN
jgi:hypothetical protein